MEPAQDYQDTLRKMQNDKRLAKSRRNLLAVSCVLIVMIFAGASLTKVNGLIFELTFESPDRLLTVLFIASVLLTIRYYNHAAKYHLAIRERWTTKLAQDEHVLSKDENTDKINGIAYLIAPRDADYDAPHGPYPELRFYPKCFFNAEFSYAIDISHDVYFRRANILKLWKEQKWEYLLALRLTITYWLKEQLNEPDSLFLFSPYLLSLLGVIFYFSVYWE